MTMIKEHEKIVISKNLDIINLVLDQEKKK